MFMTWDEPGASLWSLFTTNNQTDIIPWRWVNDDDGSDEMEGGWWALKAVPCTGSPPSDQTPYPPVPESPKLRPG